MRAQEGKGNEGRTGGILPSAYLNEFLDILYLLRHVGDFYLVKREGGWGCCWREIDTSRALTIFFWVVGRLARR